MPRSGLIPRSTWASDLASVLERVSSDNPRAQYEVDAAAVIRELLAERHEHWKWTNQQVQEKQVEIDRLHRDISDLNRELYALRSGRSLQADMALVEQLNTMREQLGHANRKNARLQARLVKEESAVTA